MNYFYLIVFFIGVSILHSNAQTSIDTINEEDVVMEMDEFLKKFKSLRDELETKYLNIDGTKLKLKYSGQYSDTPKVVVGENGKLDVVSSSTHKFYHDSDNDATFTFSKFITKDGKTFESVRGVISKDGSEIIINPYYKANKRSTDVHDGKPHVRINRKNKESMRFRDHPNLPVDRINEKINRTIIEKRQTSGPLNIYIEILSVCDYYCYQQHAKYMGSQVKEVVGNHIEGYLAQILFSANSHFKRSFDNDNQLRINLYPKSYIILTTPEASKFTTSPNQNFINQEKDAYGRIYVNGDTCLNSFNFWLVNQRQANTIPEYDIAVLYTNSNLKIPALDLYGYTPIGGACRMGSNGLIIDDNGGFSTGTVVAHEIGHSIGLNHEIPNDSPCGTQATFVMSTAGNDLTFIKGFSSCSISTLKDNFLNKKLFTCTYNVNSFAADYVNLNSYKPGQIYDGSEQCKQLYGKEFTMMVGPKSGGGVFENDMCARLYCTTDFVNTRGAFAAAEGTSCGSGKWCTDGVCQASASAPTGSCLIDDDSTFCNDFITRYGKDYTCAYYKNRCCISCGGTKIKKLYDKTTWLAGNTLDNVMFLDKVSIPACADYRSWCTSVPEWKKSSPDVCGIGWHYDYEIINEFCPKTCGTCETASVVTTTAPTTVAATTASTTNVYYSNIVDQISGKNISLRAKVNGKYFCAESYGNLPLVANKDWAMDWEMFTVLKQGPTEISLKAVVNKKYVCTDIWANSVLIANKDWAMDWEIFYVEEKGPMVIALKSKVNGKYVSTDAAGSSALVANKDTVTTTELFDVVIK